MHLCPSDFHMLSFTFPAAPTLVKGNWVGRLEVLGGSWRLSYHLPPAGHLPPARHLPPAGDRVTFCAAALFQVTGGQSWPMRGQSWEVAPLEVAAHVHPREVATQHLEEATYLGGCASFGAVGPHTLEEAEPHLVLGRESSQVAPHTSEEGAQHEEAAHAEVIESAAQHEEAAHTWGRSWCPSRGQ